jgi:hypothetical protein
MTSSAAALWAEHVQMPYPVMAEELSQDSLYSTLMAQRQGQQPAPQPFTYEAFTSSVAQQMWEDVTRKFVMGEHTVEQFVNRMNSRLQ